MTAVSVVYEPRGAARDILECRDFEVLSEGPVGTGKTFSVLWKTHLCALKYDGMRGLLARKTQRSLTDTAIQTYQKILATAPYGVKPFSGNIEEPRSFRYPNGSRLVVGGMDSPSKIMSSEYDIVAAFEATELTLEDWEAITTRLRNGVMPYQQIIADCNPGPPNHWLNVRANEGKITRLLSRHKDNPRWWDAEKNDWTPAGREYVIDRLGNLTGVRRRRNLDGIWAAAEGQVYETFDTAVHIVPEQPIPYFWPRFWVVDFGYVHPFVWQAWAMKPDGELVMYREIYMTRRLVSDHAKQIMHLTANEPKPVAVITDHDAEDRATFEHETGYRTIAANKKVKIGIQKVEERLKPVNGVPRLQFMADALVERDTRLGEEGKPCSTVEEFPSYVWPDKKTTIQRSDDEQPVKEYDHGMDCVRYLTAYFDLDGTVARGDTGRVVAELNAMFGD